MAYARSGLKIIGGFSKQVVQTQPRSLSSDRVIQKENLNATQDSSTSEDLAWTNKLSKRLKDSLEMRSKTAMPSASTDAMISQIKLERIKHKLANPPLPNQSTLGGLVAQVTTGYGQVPSVTPAWRVKSESQNPNRSVEALTPDNVLKTRKNFLDYYKARCVKSVNSPKVTDSIGTGRTSVNETTNLLSSLFQSNNASTNIASCKRKKGALENDHEFKNDIKHRNVLNEKSNIFESEIIKPVTGLTEKGTKTKNLLSKLTQRLPQIQASPLQSKIQINDNKARQMNQWLESQKGQETNEALPAESFLESNFSSQQSNVTRPRLWSQDNSLNEESFENHSRNVENMEVMDSLNPAQEGSLFPLRAVASASSSPYQVQKRTGMQMSHRAYSTVSEMDTGNRPPVPFDLQPQTELHNNSADNKQIKVFDNIQDEIRLSLMEDVLQQAKLSAADKKTSSPGALLQYTSEPVRPQTRSISTSATNYGKCPKKEKCDSGTKLPCQIKTCPKKCQERQKQVFNFGPCTKICMPCCEPAKEPPICDADKPIMVECEKSTYRVPAFSECALKYPKPFTRKKECCFYGIVPKCNPSTVAEKAVSQLVSAQVRTEIKLGQRLREFSTCAVTNGCAKESSDDFDPCKPPKKYKRPCDQEQVDKTDPRACMTINQPEIGPKVVIDQQMLTECPRICMPCCQPARYPPECRSMFVPPPCTRLRPPRPAYSECSKLKVLGHRACECVTPRPPECIKEVEPPRCPS